MTSISVIVPFYGNFDNRRLKLVIESVNTQEGVNVELIVAGLNSARRIRGLEEIEKSEEIQNSERVSTGQIMNRALQIVGTEFVYTSDADIIFRSSTYLKDLIREFERVGTALKRPPMRRLFLEDFNDFYNIVANLGLVKVVSTYNCDQKYVIKPQKGHSPIRIFLKEENGRKKVFIASESDFQEYISSEINKGSEPKFFNQDRHCGATFANIEAFRRVCGYCEKFISWGVWDADIQWKLESIVGMHLIPDMPKFEVIHFDHPKRYFDKNKWQQDRHLQERRRAQGVQECIKEDGIIYGRR